MRTSKWSPTTNLTESLHTPSVSDEAWTELLDAAAAYAGCEAEMERARERRDRAILEVARANLATRRVIADAAGVTHGRVQQILAAAGDETLTSRLEAQARRMLRPANQAITRD